MKKIRVDHVKLIPGIYKSSVSGLSTIWDVRVKSPNKGDYMTPAVMHTIEHTMSQYLEGRLGSFRVVGVFSMADQTGFYVITRFVGRALIHEAIVDYIMYIQCTSRIPGVNIHRCGHCELQDLEGARKVMLDYYTLALKYSTSALNYIK